jgi:hypothetical protein
LGIRSVRHINRRLRSHLPGYSQAQYGLAAMRYSLALPSAFAWFGLFAQPSGDGIFALRAELPRMYSYLDSAFEQRRFEDALRVVLPEATVYALGWKESRSSAHDRN